MGKMLKGASNEGKGKTSTGESKMLKGAGCKGKKKGKTSEGKGKTGNEEDTTNETGDEERPKADGRETHSGKISKSKGKGKGKKPKGAGPK